MGTQLSDVNDLFMTLINDHKLNSLFLADITNFNTFLEGWLIRAIDEFSNYCDQDLTYSITTQEFTQTLTQKNKNMLSNMMTLYWLQKEVQNVLQFSLAITDRDFSHYSEAQNLKEKKDLLLSKKEEISQNLQDYAYRTNDWSNWKNQNFDV
jgi:hypothetical protein